MDIEQDKPKEKANNKLFISELGRHDVSAAHRTTAEGWGRRSGILRVNMV